MAAATFRAVVREPARVCVNVTHLIAVTSIAAALIGSAPLAWTRSPTSSADTANPSSDARLTPPQNQLLSPAKSALLVSDIGNGANLKKDLAGWVDVDQPLSVGDTLLTDAAGVGGLDTVKFLLKSGDRIKPQANRGWTAFMVAIFCRHDAVVRYLHATEASPSIAADEGITAHKMPEWRGTCDLLSRLPRVQITSAKPTGANLVSAVEAGGKSAVQPVLCPPCSVLPRNMLRSLPPLRS